MVHCLNQQEVKGAGNSKSSESEVADLPRAAWKSGSSGVVVSCYVLTLGGDKWSNYSEARIIRIILRIIKKQLGRNTRALLLLRTIKKQVSNVIPRAS